MGEDGVQLNSYKKTKVILTGYRATGKSTVGRILSSMLDWQFVDTDLEIEKSQGLSISRMVAGNGWEFFREQERKVLTELADRRQVVIATGGGAIIHQQIWNRFIKNGLVVWLTADPETISQRLATDPATEFQRPSLTSSDILTEVESVLRKREPLYRAGSHLEIDSSGSVEEIAAEIKSFLGRINRN